MPSKSKNSNKQTDEFERIVDMMKPCCEDWTKELDELLHLYNNTKKQSLEFSEALEQAKLFVLEIDNLICNEQYEDILFKIDKFKQKYRIKS